ncbi:MAG: S1C family serine protease [Halobacteriaceae archaeon]
MPTRRQYLALAAAVAGGTAGCSESFAEDIGTTTAPDNRTATTRTATDSPGPYARVYRRTVDSVVLVRTRSVGGGGSGSGFVYRDGVVVTNDHVVDGAAAVEVRFNRGEWRDAEVVGTDAYSDLAALRVDAPDYADPLSFVETDPPIGTEVVAIGNPFGLDRSVSAGIVSGVDRAIPAPTGGFRVPDAVQTDAAVNPGNSGGPLVALDGEVVGVISAAGAENIAFAVSAALARRVLPALVETGAYDHAYMGLRLRTVTPAIAAANGLAEPRGVLVTAVLRDGPSDGAIEPAQDTDFVDGVRVPVGGDVVVAIDGRAVGSVSDVFSYLALETSPGDTVEVGLVRDGERRTVDVTLGERPPPGTAGSSGA